MKINDYVLKWENFCVKSIEYVKKTLRDTPLEVAIGLALGGAALGYLGHRFESNRDKLMPLAFSEISQIEETAKQNNKELDSFTEYYAGLNDLSMKIFECWNNAWKTAKTDKEAYDEFAKQLNKEMVEHKHHYNLSDFLESLPLQADKSLQTLKPFVEVRNRLDVADSQLTSACQSSHIDNYHTQVYTTTSTDSKGHSHTSLHTRQVYDNTTHTYTYNQAQGNLASTSLDSVVKDFENLSLVTQLKIARKVGTENEKAIETSRKLKQGDMTQNQLLELSDKWAEGSDFNANSQALVHPMTTIKSNADAWRQAKNTAKSTSYINCNSHDAGPHEFALADKVTASDKALKTSIDNLVAGINQSKSVFPELHQKLLDYTQSSHNPNFNKKAAAYEIRDMASKLYKANFKKGFDVEGYRLRAILLYIIAGVTIGGLAGFATDTLADKYQLWGKPARNPDESFDNF
jgi:hypothetical protein